MESDGGVPVDVREERIFRAFQLDFSRGLMYIGETVVQCFQYGAI